MKLSKVVLYFTNKQQNIVINHVNQIIPLEATILVRTPETDYNVERRNLLYYTETWVDELSTNDRKVLRHAGE